MGVINVIDREGKIHVLEALEGWRIMEIIRDWGLPMEGLCGGAAECGTCHVFVAPEWLPKLFPARDEEEASRFVADEQIRPVATEMCADSTGFMRAAGLHDESLRIAEGQDL